MKKLLAVVFSTLFVVAAAVPVLATDARQEALGYTGNYIEDDYNIFTWYGTLPSYSNTVWIGLDYDSYYYAKLGAAEANGNGDGGRPYIGAAYGLGSEGKYGTLAMFFNYYGRPLNPGYGWDSYGQPFTSSTYSKWNVLYGYAMEKLSFGLYFGRSDASYTGEFSYAIPAASMDTLFNDESSIAYTTLGAGIRFDIGEKMYADLAFDYNWASQTWSYQTSETGYNNGYGEITADANKMMNFRGRMFYEWNETVTWVPYIAFSMFDFSLQGDSAKFFNQGYYDNYYARYRAGMVDTLDWKETNYGVKGMMMTFGLGANLKVNENNLLIFAVEPFSYGKIEPSDAPPDSFMRYDDYYCNEPGYGNMYYDDPSSWGVTYESKRTYLPTFYLALESDVRDWLTFRIGAYKDFYKVEDTESWTSRSRTGTSAPTVVTEYSETTTNTYSDFGYWMGLGFHVGDFDIDAVVNNNLPFRIGYWLTGYSNNYDGPPVYVLSAAYHF